MARSIHSTLSDHRDEFYGRRRPEELARIAAELERKRRLKRRVRDVRRRQADLPAVSPETIPIEVRDAGPFVHHPAGPDDLRAVIRRLPPGTLDGLAGITLCLGAEHQQELAADDDDPVYEPDPYIGRLGWQLPLPGVFTGLSGGFYAPWSNQIEIFAYVFHPNMPDRNVFEVYLRLRRLAVFLHELAHHNFWLNHDPRSRWSQEDHDRCEDQTEELAGRWVADYAIPYLEEIYPSEVAAFRRWIVAHGGVDVPLLWLASGWLPARSGVERAWFGTADEALYDLVESAREGVEPTTARLRYARNLHYGGFYAEALQIIDGILTLDPSHDEALTLKADIHVHQERYDEAEGIVRQVLVRCPESFNAWKILTDILLQGRRWHELWAAGVETIRQFGQSAAPGDISAIFGKCVPAALHLGLHEPLDELCKLHEKLYPYRHGQIMSAAAEAISCFCRQKYGIARRIAVKALGDKEPVMPWEYVLASVRFEAAQRLGWAKEAGNLPPNAVHQLRQLGLESFADALVRRLQAEK